MAEDRKDVDYSLTSELPVVYHGLKVSPEVDDIVIANNAFAEGVVQGTVAVHGPAAESAARACMEDPAGMLKDALKVFDPNETMPDGQVKMPVFEAYDKCVTQMLEKKDPSKGIVGMTVDQLTALERNEIPAGMTVNQLAAIEDYNNATREALAATAKPDTEKSRSYSRDLAMGR